MRPLCYTKVRIKPTEISAWLNLCLVELLETVLFAQIRFHDTVSRGRLLNRFGKDFEGARRL